MEIWLIEKKRMNICVFQKVNKWKGGFHLRDARSGLEKNDCCLRLRVVGKKEEAKELVPLAMCDSAISQWAINEISRCVMKSWKKPLVDVDCSHAHEE